MDDEGKPNIGESIVNAINGIFQATAKELGIPVLAVLKNLTIQVYHTTQTGDRMSPINLADDICESTMLYAYLTLEIDGKMAGTHSKIYVDENLMLDLAAVDVDEVEIEPEDVEDETIREEYQNALEKAAKTLTAVTIQVLQLEVKKEEIKKKEEG